jgi:hypothetical protein
MHFLFAFPGILPQTFCILLHLQNNHYAILYQQARFPVCQSIQGNLSITIFPQKTPSSR